MSIKILTDTASDILPSEAEALGIRLVPLTLNFDGVEYADAFEIGHVEFFQKLTGSNIFPTTSQVTPAAYSEILADMTADGSSVIVITLSSKLSGTYQSACIAAEEYGEKVFVVDSLSATIGQRLLVMEGVKYIAQGLSAAEAAAKLTEDRDHIRIRAVIDTLEYLKKGGRISSAVALAGGLLSIKPAISVDGGTVNMLGKARGTKNSYSLLRKLIQESAGIDCGRNFYFIYSGLSDELLQEFLKENADLWNGLDVSDRVTSLGPVIGTHIGPNAYGIAYFDRPAN